MTQKEKNRFGETEKKDRITLTNMHEDMTFLDDETEEMKVYAERESRQRRGLERETSQKENKRFLLLGVILVLSIALFTALIVDVVTNKNSNSPGNLRVVNNNEIRSLVTDYISAIEQCDMKALEKTVDSMENISQDKLELENEYIEKYENVKMFYVKGLHEDEYVIFVTYDNKILNIDTLAPGGMMLYVILTGKEYKVHTGINQDVERMEYLVKLSEDEEIVAFNKKIDEELEKACKTDKKLASFIEALTTSDKN